MNERQVANKALELADKLEMLQVAQYGDRELCVAPTEIHKQAADMLRSQVKYINRLHKLCNANGIGVGRNLLTGEVIPFEVEDEK